MRLLAKMFNQWCAYKLTCKLISLAVTIFVVVLTVTLVLVLLPSKDPAPVTGSHFFKNAAVTANGQECAEIGSEILKRNGSAADAAIATLFCDGIACGQCMGLGGGFLLTIYTHATAKVEVLNSREVAPLKATEDMFEGGNISTTTGGLAVAVPGELRGYQALHKKYGILPWKDLIEPTIKLCREGYIVTEYLARILSGREDRILAEPTLRDVFINPATGHVWLQGDKIKRLKLAETLEIIAVEGADALYNGSLTKRFVDDIKSLGGIISEDDLKAYTPEWLTPLEIDLGDDHKLHTVPLPGSGYLLSLIINTLRGWIVPENVDSDEQFDVEEDGTLYWHRTIEAFKYAFAKRTGLGDAKFLPSEKIEPLLTNMTSIEYAHYLRTIIPDNKTFNDYEHYGTEFGILEDHGTAHISVLAPNGDAVAVTSTINDILGAMVRSVSTGIILNDEMDDFSYPNITNIYNRPPSPSNYPKPGKRPMSSMTPSIVVQKGRGPRLIIGAAGGTKIPTQVASVILKHLLSGVPLKEAIDAPRAHHQLFPMEIQYEYNFNMTVVEQLRSLGHKVSSPTVNSGFAAMTAISVNRTSGYIEAEFDHRRIGSAAGY